MDECVLGGMGLSQEDLIKRSPNGKHFRVLLDAVLHVCLEVKKITDIALAMITSVDECIAGNRH